MGLILSKAAEEIIKTLNRAGYEAYAVGGCVRDALLGREPQDWDICTSALPEETMECFPHCRIHTIGLKHGTILLIMDGEGCEVTTYRTDGAYTDHRHPDGVTFVRSLREDLARRDFTINAMAWHPGKGLIDFFDGKNDLKNGVIRCVGEPERRFEEDGLRILRGLRFASRYGFRIEEATGQAIHQKRELLRLVAGERVLEELRGFFQGKSAGELLMNYRDVFSVIMPELAPMFDHPQYNPHHCYDVWEHTCHAVEWVAGDATLGLTMLFHDAGKPKCFTRDKNGVGHFHGHPVESARIAERVLKRLHCDTKTRENILTLIEWHDRLRIFNRKNARAMLAELGEEQTRQLFVVMEADARAQNPAQLEAKLEALGKGKAILEELLKEDACFTLKALKVQGRDLIDLGWKPGPELGEALHWLLDAVMEERVPNEREALLKYLAGFPSKM